MEHLPQWFKVAFVFVLGLEFGSFANVCIYRWPRASSVLRPNRSFCPWCSVSIHWFDNIPVISFILLRARCRACRSPISFRYPIVELAMGILWVLLYQRLGPVAHTGEAAFMAAILALGFTAVVTTMTDLDWRQIPDNSTAVLAVIGVATAFANPLLGDTWPARIGASLIGLTIGGGILWLLGYAGELMFGKEAMGGGDVKLLGAMGTVVGWELALATLFLAALLGGVVVVAGLLTGRLKRHQYVPFGPFLNVAALALLLGMGPHLMTVDLFGLRGLM